MQVQLVCVWQELFRPTLSQQLPNTRCSALNYSAVRRTLGFVSATLPNSLISSNSVLVESLGFSAYKNASSANRDKVTPSLGGHMPFLSLLAWLLWQDLPPCVEKQRWEWAFSCSWSWRKSSQPFTTELSIHPPANAIHHINRMEEKIIW